MKVKYLYAAISVVCMVSFTSTAYAEWNYGIGTGLSRKNVEGDHGYNISFDGPVTFDVDLDPDDLSDITESAFGFGGYATDKTWMIQYSFVNLELESTTNRPVPSSTTVSTKRALDIRGGEVTVGYPVLKSTSLVLSVFGGVRYTKHDFSYTAWSGGSQESRNFDHDWTDALLGVAAAVPFAEKWVWNTRLEAGFGGSEGSAGLSTGVSWRFYKNWSTSLKASYLAVEFENGSKGDADWYLYDVDETALSLGFLYHF